MPFDITKSSGTWKMTKHSDNYPKIMTKMGIILPIHKAVKDAVITTETTVSGKKLTYKKTILGRTTENTITLGEECEETDPNGDMATRKVTYTLEGDTLVSVYPDYDGEGLVVRQTRRWVGDKTIRTEYKVGDLEGWTEVQKI